MAVNDVYEVALVGSQTGSEIVATLNYRTTISVGPKTEEMLALAEELLLTWVPSIAALQSSTVTYNTIRVRDVHNPLLGVDRPVSGAGTKAGQPLPKQIAALITWKTGLIGRRNTGRQYLGGMTEDDWDGANWVAGLLTAITAYAGEMNFLEIVDFPVAGDAFSWQQVVHSDTYDVTNDIITFGVSAAPATQRRRKSGVGS